MQKVTYRLDDLLVGITDENTHGELSVGKPVGKEALRWKSADISPKPVRSCSALLTQDNHDQKPPLRGSNPG